MRHLIHNEIYECMYMYIDGMVVTTTKRNVHIQLWENSKHLSQPLIFTRPTSDNTWIISCNSRSENSVLSSEELLLITGISPSPISCSWNKQVSVHRERRFQGGVQANPWYYIILVSLCIFYPQCFYFTLLVIKANLFNGWMFMFLGIFILRNTTSIIKL